MPGSLRFLTTKNFGFVRVFASLFSLILIWSLMLPLFAGPDEHSNFVKSAAVMRGEFVGSNIEATPAMSYWATQVNIDPRFGSALGVPSCFIFASDKPACDVPIGSGPVADTPPWTQMGRYPPIAFMVSGLGTIFGPRDLSAFASRTTIGLLCAFFVSIAICTLKKRGRTSIGILMAVTPGVVFISAVNSPSGAEICSAIALWVLAPELFAGQSLSRFEKFGLGLAGLFLIGSRPLGFTMYALILGISACLSWSQRREWYKILRSRWLVGSQLIGLTFSFWWFIWIYNFQTSPKVVDGMPALPRSEQLMSVVMHLPSVVEQAFGNYGWLDSPTPTLAFYCGIGAILAVLGSRWSSAVKTVKVAVVGLVVITLLLALLIDLQYYSMLRGFGLQGRHIMPLLVGVPILIFWRCEWRGNREVWIAGTWTVIMFWCGASALRRYSTGIKPFNTFEMLKHPMWIPLLGIWGTLVLLVATSALVGVVVVRPFSTNE